MAVEEGADGQNPELEDVGLRVVLLAEVAQRLYGNGGSVVAILDHVCQEIFKPEIPDQLAGAKVTDLAGLVGAGLEAVDERVHLNRSS
jgi:hypothetical protein